MKLCWKLQKEPNGDILILPIDTIEEHLHRFEDAQIGDKWIFEVIEMDENELDELEPFDDVCRW